VKGTCDPVRLFQLVSKAVHPLGVAVLAFNVVPEDFLVKFVEFGFSLVHRRIPGKAARIFRKKYS
jgi:hypothetical protein